MRRRLPVAAASAALAATLLTACHSNVGAAATVDGHRITESDVSKYITANARALNGQDASGQPTSIPAKAFVLKTLLDEQLFDKVLRELRAETNRAYPTPAEFNTAEQQYLDQNYGGDVKNLQQGVVQAGLKSSFTQVYLREGTLGQILGTEASADNGAKLDQVVAKLHPKVSVNPRYGTWDEKAFALSATQKDGLPSFLHASATYTPPAPAVSSPAEPAPSATG